MAKKGPVRDGAREKQWREAISRWRSSGMTIRKRPFTLSAAPLSARGDSLGLPHPPKRALRSRQDLSQGILDPF